MKTKITIWQLKGSHAKFERELDAEVFYPDVVKRTGIDEHLEIQIGSRLLFIPMNVVIKVIERHNFWKQGNLISRNIT